MLLAEWLSEDGGAQKLHKRSSGKLSQSK